MAVLATAPFALKAQSPDTVLVSNSLAKVTKAEYDAELLKLPPDLRGGFANNPRRVNELLQRMLMQKSLAAQAREAGLDKRPDIKTRLDLEVEKFLSTMQIEAIDSTLEGDLDLRGFLGISPDVRKGYREIRVTMRVKSKASPALLRELAQYSPVFDVCSRALPVKVEVVTV